MGAKSALKLRNRGIAFKCNLCGRKLMTADALAVHQRTTHNVSAKRRMRLPPVAKPAKVAKTRATEDIEVKTTAPPAPDQTTVSSTVKKTKNMVEFECPKCFKAFPTYFFALKHIQKHHSVEKQNSPLPTDPSNIIQPLRVELCTKCMCKVKCLQTHVCKLPPKNTHDSNKMYVCAACEEWFPSLHAFDFHIVSSHGDCVESLFFPTSIEYTKWKTEMEQQTNVNFVILKQEDTKRYYHCNYMTEHRDKSNTNYICPATILIQEFPKGIQVHFYHKHYKHTSRTYKLPAKYKKYSISSFLKSTEDYKNLASLKQDDEDLYMQFKMLMEGIIVDAAKINIATLKILLGKALEMTSILTNYDEELDISTVASNPKQNMSDVEITRALEEPLPETNVSKATTTFSDGLLDVSLAKRKSSASVGDDHAKRLKSNEYENDMEIISPKIVNSYSLAEPLNNNKLIETEKAIIRQPDIEQVDEKKSKVNGEETPSSFNDSYKDFVVKNFPNMESVASRTRSKPTVKTRIGQFKPVLTKIEDKSITLPTKIMEERPMMLTKIKNPILTKILDGKVKFVAKQTKTTPDINKSVKPPTNTTKTGEDKTKSTNVPPIVEENKIIQMDKSKVADKKIVADPKETPKVPRAKVELPRTKTPPVKNVEISRTKTPPAKRVDTPKAKTITRNYSVTSRTSFDKPKVDFEYEVKEQVDDCNILILKL